MRLVTANIQTQLSKLDERRALATLGAQGIAVTEVKGFGQQKGHTEIYRGTEYASSFVPKVRIDLVAASEQADEVIATIQDTARTRQVGDGKISVSPIERAVRTRAGKTDKGAGQTFTDISCDKEADNGIRDIRAPKTRVIRGCSHGDHASLPCIR
jgi:nitrogen regulatory protein P-II 2